MQKPLQMREIRFGHPIAKVGSRFNRMRHNERYQERRGEKPRMQNLLTKLYVKAQILRDDAGQDLIEYALVVALIAFAATVGMSTVASDINLAFSKIGSKLTTYIS